MRIVLLSTLGLTTLLLTSPATATLIAYDPAYDPAAPKAEWAAYIPPIYRFAGTTSYNAATDILTLTASPFGGPGTGSSSFLLIAGVNETGGLLGGSATWLGGIPSLGVPPGTTLLAGNVIAVEYGFFDGVSPGIDFVIQVEESLPALGLGPFVGYSNAVIPWALPVPGDPLRGADPWSTSVGGAQPYTADALLNVVRVPQAPTLVLFIAGIGVCLGLRRPRARSACQYSTAASV